MKEEELYGADVRGGECLKKEEIDLCVDKC